MLLPLVLALAKPQLDLYIGTYTAPNGSQGIYHARLDTETGRLSEPTLAAEAPNPSFLAVHPSGRFLYAVHESTGGDVAAYAVGAEGKLRHLNTQTSGSPGPCHLSLDRSGRYVFSASYGGGGVACFPVQEDGSLSSPSSTFQNVGSGPNRSRQDRPHLHAIQADARGRHVYACDLGTDEVLIFRFDARGGKLSLGNPRAATASPGAGPRHVALHPNGKYLFVDNEMGNSVTSYAIAADNLLEVDTESTLPPGEPTQGRSTAEIVCHPSGKWLYVSNRGHDSIAVFAIGANGKLTLSEIKDAGVREPRGFDVDPTGRWLVVAGQNSDDLTSLAIDPKTGRLTATPHRVRLHRPVCVAFVRPR